MNQEVVLDIAKRLGSAEPTATNLERWFLMNEIGQQTEEAKDIVDPSDTVLAKADVSSLGRRRLIKLGITAVPVVATLASRPALAWHCKTPSAWGSELINPTTSLATNGAHPKHNDECWFIENWAQNNSTGTSLGIPWTVLLNSNSDLKTACQGKWSNVTVAMLNTYASFQYPYNVPTTLAKNILSGAANPTSFQKSTLTALLNARAASGILASCVMTLKNLTDMANKRFEFGGHTWTEAEVDKFLRCNWIGRSNAEALSCPA